MRFLKAIALALVLTAGATGVVSAPTPAMAQTYSQLTGVWQGVYWGEGNQPTAFQATLQQGANGEFTGSIVETNTFSEEQIPFLLATIRGSVRGATVTFVKTYDGTGGQTHTINYSGQLSSGGRHVVGEWEANGARGRFELGR